jgi:hypothetical protein
MAMASILANALRHVQRLAQAATSVAVLIDPGNRRARIETTSQIGWFNLAEPALRRSVETEGAAGGARRKPASGRGSNHRAPKKAGRSSARAKKAS